MEGVPCPLENVLLETLVDCGIGLGVWFGELRMTGADSEFSSVLTKLTYTYTHACTPLAERPSECPEERPKTAPCPPSHSRLWWSWLPEDFRKTWG